MPAYSGTLSDIFGRKPVSVILSLCFSLGLMLTISAIVMNSLIFLYIAIAIQAMGAGNLSVTLAATSDYAKNEQEAFRNQYIVQDMFWGRQSLIQMLTTG